MGLGGSVCDSVRYPGACGTGDVRLIFSLFCLLSYVLGVSVVKRLKLNGRDF